MPSPSHVLVKILSINLWSLKKHPSKYVLLKECSEIFCKIHRKRPAVEMYNNSQNIGD